MQNHTVHVRLSLLSAREVGHRLTVSFVSLSVILLTWLEPTSLRFRVIEDSGELGWWFTFAMAFLSVVAILDVLVNDLLPNRYTLPMVMKGRMYAYMLQGTMHLSLVAAITHWHTWAWTAAIHLVMAGSCVWIAVMDTYYRFIEPRQRSETK